MHKSHRAKRRPQNDAAAPRFGRSRRLAIETMESRMMLSGNQIDYSIWNLDSLQSNYAIISQGDSLPRPSTSTSSAAGPSGADLDVSWVAVPDMLLSASDAQQLAYQQYREAMSQGVINFQQSSALYQQWLSGFSSDAGSTLVPVYTIGIRSHAVTPAIGGLTDLFSDSNSTTSSGLMASDSTFGNTPPLVSSFGSTGSSFGVNTIPILYNSAASGLDADVRSSGDFNRDGLVDAADYRVWRDVAGPSDMLAYNNWKANFGQSFVDVAKVADILNNGPLGSNLAVDHDGVLDPQPTITIDVTRTSELSTPNGTLTAAIDLTLGGQDDAFASGTPRIIRPTPDEPSGDSLPSTIGTFAHGELIVTINPVTFTKTEDTGMATSGPMLIVNIDGSSSQLVISASSAKIDAPSARQSKAEEELDQAIDELLAEDTIFVQNSGEAAGGTSSSAAPTEIVSTGEQPATGLALEEESANAEVAAEPAVDLLAEGGMVPVETIVGAVATGSIEIAPTEQLAGADEASDVVGELARVAVMELIEGANEPMAPVVEGDHVALVAMRDGVVSDRAIAVARGEFAAAELSIARTFAEQAGAAIALVMPMSPGNVAALVSSVSGVFAGVVFGEESSAGDARSEAFAQLDESESVSVADDSPNGWLDAAPLVALLACERVVAANRKRQQRDPVRRPAKRPLPPTDAC